jgi:hypothetical protein
MGTIDEATAAAAAEARAADIAVPAAEARTLPAAEERTESMAELAADRKAVPAAEVRAVLIADPATEASVVPAAAARWVACAAAAVSAAVDLCRACGELGLLVWTSGVVCGAAAGAERGRTNAESGGGTIGDALAPAARCSGVGIQPCLNFREAMISCLC